MPISPEGLEAIKQAEGTRRDPKTGRQVIHDDGVGKLTVGHGHKLTAAETRSKTFAGGLTDKEALDLLAKDVATAEKAVSDLVKGPLNQNQFDALVSFTYNLGGRRLKNSQLLKKVNAGDFAAVPAELAKWNKGMNPKTGKLVVLPGLATRRAAEALRFSQPVGGGAGGGAHDLAPHSLAPHDLAPHDREPHDREPHDLTPHDLTPHDLEPHQLEPHQLEPHQLEPHQLEPHQLEGGHLLQG